MHPSAIGMNSSPGISECITPEAEQSSTGHHLNLACRYDHANLRVGIYLPAYMSRFQGLCADGLEPPWRVLDLSRQDPFHQVTERDQALK